MLSRRNFLSGVLLGGATGVIATTGVHAVSRDESVESPVAEHQSGLLPAVDDSSSITSDQQEPSNVDIGFCTDMTAHHVQALVMCERVLGFDTGDAVQAAATEVLRNQSIEVGMMRAWLADWGASTAPPERVMAWMDMSDSMDLSDSVDMSDSATSEMSDMGGSVAADIGIPLSEMPGYATDAEVLGLSQAEPGIAKGRVWLTLMRAHHVGGVAMAEAAMGLAVSDKVRRLARNQAAVQSFEIDQYDLLLNGLYS